MLIVTFGKRRVCIVSKRGKINFAQQMQRRPQITNLTEIRLVLSEMNMQTYARWTDTTSQICVHFTNWVQTAHHCFDSLQLTERQLQTITSEARVHTRFSPCEICGEQSDTGAGFPPSSSPVLLHLMY
jgi:hypothetical protein